MATFHYLRPKELEKVVEGLTEVERKSLFNTMDAYRKQWSREVHVSGWSETYRELYDLQEKKVEEVFGYRLEAFTEDRLWDILSDMYLYNQL